MNNSKLKQRLFILPCKLILFASFLFISTVSSYAAMCEIRHAQTLQENGFYILAADIDYVLHSEAQQILDKGLSVKFVIQAELSEKRRFWVDRTLILKEQVFYLQKNQLTKKFILTTTNSNKQQSFSTASEALLALNNSVNIPLIEISKIGNPLNIQARARLVVDVRHFSGTVNYLAKFWDDWRLVSEWYTWPLKL